MLAMTVSLFEEYDGLVLAERGPAVVSNLVKVAQHNPQLMKALVSLSHGGTYAALIGSIASLVLPMLAHHGYAPLMFGMMSPDMLETHHRMVREKTPFQPTSNGFRPVPND